MGPQALVPFFVWAALILYCAVYRVDGAWSFSQQLPVLEMILPTFSAWWSICLFQDILEEEGSETLFSYPIPRWKLGLIRVIFFWVLYCLGIIVVLGILQTWTSQPFWLPLALQFITQAFFFSSFGFLAVAITAQVGWAILIVSGYAVVEQLIGFLLPSFLNVYIFNTAPLPLNQWIVWRPLLYGIILMMLAQGILHRFRRFH